MSQRAIFTQAELEREPCPMGGAHRLTRPRLWVGTSCWRRHQTWEGTGLVPTWPVLGAAREVREP